MPIYEYQCEKCAHEFEREQRITEDPVKVCPKCRAKKVRRLISRTAFVLKGGGWYSDLYSSAKPSSDSADKGESKTEAKSEAKTESKAETKAESSSKSDGSGKGGKSKGKSKSAKAA